jgi:betaine-homocysteine S-methyltransferase
VGGNVCNTNAWDPNNMVESRLMVEEMFREQVQWAKEANVDFMLGETFSFLEEALLALSIIR